MPIRIPDGLPAIEALEKENIFVMGEQRATHQDIRPLKIAVLNLMPTKITTETQLIRLLSNTSLQIKLTLLTTESHVSTHTSAEHMSSFYRSISDIKDEYFDGLIVTGAPIETKAYEDIDYWPEMCRIMDWSKTHVFSTMYICWAAQASLYHFYNIGKHPLENKMFGVFSHETLNLFHPLVRGFDEEFYAPHSRNTAINEDELAKENNLEVLAKSQMAGVYLIAEKGMRKVFITGHCEYDRETLAKEYFRDVDKGLNIKVPYNYFPNDDPTKTPLNKWRGHANLLFSNWIEHIVYQLTPYDLEELSK